MTPEQFVDRAKPLIGVHTVVSTANADYESLKEAYIKANAPHPVGKHLAIDNVGMNHDYRAHRAKHRAFVINHYEVETKPDGSPVIIANGDILVSGDKHTDKKLGTFRVIVHGTMSVTTFEEYVIIKKADRK